MTDAQWRSKASSWGQYVTEDGTLVTMMRKGQRVRFYDAEGEQHGPEQANVCPAVIYAAWRGWINPSSPMLSLACISEVRGQVGAP